ncbi:unnamed protein product [Rangifer tarandus platyrhynchus]|uniref:Uncharacterized protein n=1 Tax=Rangifer tarandus platyrhynchus TaxID=3082113 RepID=A0AC59Z9M1_RANTA
MIDTGSSELWVPSTHCHSPSCLTHSLFNPHKSTTFKLLDNPVDLIYASGRINGVLGQDVIQYTVPCNTTSTLPPLIFTIKGIDYPVPAQAYIHENSEGLCYSTFRNGKQHENEAETWVLGNVFLRLYISVYDREKYRIGLAPAV